MFLFCFLILLLAILVLFQWQKQLSMQEDYERSRQDLFEIQELIAKIPKKTPSIQSNQSLFFLVTKLTENSQLSSKLTLIQPIENNDGERLNIRLENLYLDQFIAWLEELSKHKSIDIEQLNLTRTEQNTLNFSLILQSQR